MQEEKFKVRALGFGELAQLYFPNISKKSASIQLSRWLKINVELNKNLSVYGFKNGQKLLTPKQVELIVNYLGEP